MYMYTNGKDTNDIQQPRFKLQSIVLIPFHETAREESPEEKIKTTPDPGYIFETKGRDREGGCGRAFWSAPGLGFRFQARI